MGLVGSLHPSLLDGRLQVMNISRNGLTGSLEAMFAPLAALRRQLQAGSDRANGSSVRVLDLHGNVLTGSVPASVSMLTALEVLDLYV
jgi:hypothetical protein